MSGRISHRRTRSTVMEDRQNDDVGVDSVVKTVLKSSNDEVCDPR